MCSTITTVYVWIVFLFILFPLSLISIVYTFQTGTFTIPAAHAFNAKRRLCIWDRHICILYNSAEGDQLVLATCTSDKSFPTTSFLRRCKVSPSSHFHIARRRIKFLPLLFFFSFLYLLFFPQTQNALGNEMLDFTSSSSCWLKNIINKQIQFTS